MKSVFCILLLAASVGVALSAGCDEDSTCFGGAYCVDANNSNVAWPSSDYPTKTGRDDHSCSCADMQLGTGYDGTSDSTTGGCSNTGYVLRVTNLANESDVATVKGLVSCDGNMQKNSDDRTVCMSAYEMKHQDLDQGLDFYSVNFLFYSNSGDAWDDAVTRLDGYNPRPYAWNAGTTSSPLSIPPSGMEVTAVEFEPSCAQSGCWVIKVDYTVGHSDHKVAGQPMGLNTFYLPWSNGNDALAEDFDYSAVEHTYSPANFPCNTHRYIEASGNVNEASSNDQVTLECLGTEFTEENVHPFGGSAGTGFLGNYRAPETFVTWASSAYSSTSNPEDVFPDTVAETLGFLKPSASNKFAGMPNSPGIFSFEAVDAYAGMYKGVIKVDEVELRRKAGQLRGTVGVEHTVDFFLGYVNMKPATGSVVVDAMATQAAIHVEKTNFFSVSTHGTNDYTFLEYVNLRLVAIYKEDADFSDQTSDETTDNFLRTNSTGAAHYVQVTFTMGDQYQPNIESGGLIPVDSVRAGEGTFFDSPDTDMQHKCAMYNESAGYDAFPDKGVFVSRLAQSCAPLSSMCISPSEVPDQFVSYNIPLGIDFFNDPSPQLSENVFVSMVINAVDTVARGSDSNPNGGEAPWQMKTTLTASIPIVRGGINIFCDGLTGKTDLTEVASAHIVVGSAKDASELTRLRILRDIESTSLNPGDVEEIDSDSIEAGLMTLVLDGDDAYFLNNNGRDDVSLELEDVITIHIMADDGDVAIDETDTSTDPVHPSTFVDNLLKKPADDNTVSAGLDTDGYALNGAFFFTVDRSAQRAHLEPSAELLARCPFNPPRPDTGAFPLYTCVTRRDVRYRGFPARTGALPTAMEICTVGDGVCNDQVNSEESDFFVTVLGDNDYAKQLAVDYAGVISSEFKLNGRYKRAFWINPGYEWTPTQTGGRSPFSISQKLFLFALVTLDEGIATDPGNQVRRRMLLQSSSDALKEGQNGVGGSQFSFQSTPRSMMASAYDVPIDRVATFDVEMQLTQQEACLPEAQLQKAILSTLDDYLTGDVISKLETVTITKMSINKAGVSCGRRSLRGLKAAGSYSDATAVVTVLVVFEKGTTSQVNLERLGAMPGINSFVAAEVSDKVDTSLTADARVTTPNDDDEDGGSSSNIGLIAGIAGGVGAVVVLAVGAFVFMRSKKQAEPVMAVQTINVEDLKSQLAGEV